MNEMINIYTELAKGEYWLKLHRNQPPVFACILGFTQSGLIEGISAAGATPFARQYTAIADAEFLINGVESKPQYPLPPLEVGASPVFISRAVVSSLLIPVYLFNAGLPHHPSVSAIDLKGAPAQCLSNGQALSLDIVHHLFIQGLEWGKKLATEAKGKYLILGECVVGGTTTALAVLTALGIDARGKVNSSHPRCNHSQKWSVVEAGLSKAGLLGLSKAVDPFTIVAAVGDPMQIVAAGIAISASQSLGVMLAGGTQMLAVYALIEAISKHRHIKAQKDAIVVGTTRWVCEDPTGDTVGLAQSIGKVPLLATGLSFATSIYPKLQVYEQGYVKEGVGAGGCAIAAHLSGGWTQVQLLEAIETLVGQFQSLRLDSARK